MPVNKLVEPAHCISASALEKRHIGESPGAAASQAPAVACDKHGKSFIIMINPVINQCFFIITMYGLCMVHKSSRSF